MIFRVKNNKPVRRIADRSFWDNKTRNIIAVMAIALTSVLFTAVFTIGSGMVENLQRQTMRQAGGDGMGVLKYITDEEYRQLKDHELIEEISYNRILSDSVENEGLLKRHGEFYYMDDTGIKLGFCEPVEGHKPEAENEIMMDTRTIQLLGIEKAIGAPVTLELVVHGKAVSRDFVLSGWWEADPVFNVSILAASRAYVEAHIDELDKSDGAVEDKDAAGNWGMAGTINSYIMFRNSWRLEDKMERVIVESGFSMDETADNYIESNVNWSYLSGSFGSDPVTAAGMAAALLLIVLTGYLIIYNIFQISVVKDIHFYGLLKTIGTTGRQIKKIIRRQAFMLSAAGIPLGLAGGYAAGCGLVPVVMESIAVDGKGFVTEISANPLIFIGSTLFSLFTAAVSTARPGRIAARVSPVEAVRYTEGAEAAGEGKIRKHAGKGRKKQNVRRPVFFRSKIVSMAAANFGRDKKRTFLVLLSISLSIVLFHAVYTFRIGFDMDKFLSKFVRADFMAAHAAYFNYQYTGRDTSVPEGMIEAMEEQEGFEEGGRMYANIRDTECFSVDPVEGRREIYFGTEMEEGTMLCAVYGMEDFPLGQLEVVEGEIDVEKLKTGKYILEGLACGDDGEPLPGASHYAVGDKVSLHNYKGGADVRSENQRMDYELEVMAKVKVETYINSCGMGFDYSFYLPAEAYKKMVSQPAVMAYVCNVSPEGKAGMEAFLERYTEEEAPEMSYTSKGKREGEFEGIRNMVLLAGGMLSFIMGLIGILNFMNSMLTSIIARRREFAILCSIGMTGGQLRKMLVMEGMIYTVSSGIAALVLGTALSFAILRQLLSAVWFFSYRFTLLPLIGLFPILLLAGMLIPMIAIHFWVKNTDIINNI